MVLFMQAVKDSLDEGTKVYYEGSSEGWELFRFDDLYACAWAADKLASEGYVVEYVGKNDAMLAVFNRSPIFAKQDPNSIDDLTLGIAWAVRDFWKSGWPNGRELWRHVLECGVKVGSIDYEGRGSTGSCETCYYEFDAVTWYFTCNCGMLSLGDNRYPMETNKYGEAMELSSIIASQLEMMDTYKSTSVSYPRYLPVISRIEGIKAPKRKTFKLPAAK